MGVGSVGFWPLNELRLLLAQEERGERRVSRALTDQALPALTRSSCYRGSVLLLAPSALSTH